MKSWSMTPLLGALLLSCVLFASSAVAKTAGYCVECHSQNLGFNGSSQFYSSAQIESRNVFQARLNPCPGVSSLSEETFFIESRLVSLNRMAAALDQEGTVARSWRQKVAEGGDSLAQMKMGAENSVSHFSKGATVLRGGLQKVYDQAFLGRAESERRWLIGMSGILLVLLLVFAGIGYRKLSGFRKKVLLVALITGSFSLSACTQSGSETKQKSLAQERLDQAQMVAARLSASVEDNFHSAVLLAQLAKDWARIEPANGDKAFQLAWQMALKTREESSQAAQIKKVAEQWPTPVDAARQKVNFDAVLNLRDELKGIEGRTWALRAIAEEWSQVHPQEGRRALDSATQEAQGIKEGDIRDIELKAIAEAWARIDENRALETARAIQHPFLKSVSLAGIARTLKGKDMGRDLFEESWKLAETVTPETLKIFACAKISAGAAAARPENKDEWAKRAQATMRDLKDPLLRVYALQEMVFSWASSDWERAEEWAGEIPANQAEAGVFALIQIGRSKGIPKEKSEAVLKKALAETDRIEDSFQAQKTRTLILLTLAGLNPREAAKSLPKIGDTILRSEVEVRIIDQMATKNGEKALETAGKIPDEFTRTRAILKILLEKVPRDVAKVSSLHQDSMQTGLSISDPYSRAMFLIELGKSWGRFDKAREAGAYEMAGKVAGEISSPSLRADVLEALASAWKASNKTKAQSVMESMDTGVLRARGVVEEARLWAKTDFEKARRMAESIPATYPFEKAQALRDVAKSGKVSDPAQALKLLENAWAIIVGVPEGTSREKVLGQVLNDAAALNLDKAFAMVRAISDRQVKDSLLKDAGNALLKGESPAGLGGALKIAKEISESSTRTGLYQKIAERTLKETGDSGITDRAILSALVQWGLGRETVRKEDQEAAPHYEKAFLEIAKISDPQERVFVLAGMMGDWAQIDEVKALAAAEKISGEFAEPLSYGLLQVSMQLRKWNRKEAERAFQKTLSVAESIQDPSLKAQRMVQIGRQWQPINMEKGKEILMKADGISKDPYKRAKAMLESAKVISKETIDKDILLLEKVSQFGQGNKNARILSEAAIIWTRIDLSKGQEILAQIDSKEARIKALRQMAQQMAKVQPEVSKGLLEKAAQEALSMEGLKEKVPALRFIAGDLAGLDPGKAKATYMLAYQAAQRVISIGSKF